MQNVIGGRAEQQRETVTAVATDHDQVDVVFLRQVVDFLTRLAVGQMAVAGFYVRVFAFQRFQFFLGLIELLLLQLRQVHRDIATERHGHGFDDVHQRQLGAAGQCQCHGFFDHRIALFSEVHGYQDMFIGHGVFLLRFAMVLIMSLFTRLWHADVVHPPLAAAGGVQI